MANTFERSSDSKLLQHRTVRIVNILTITIDFTILEKSISAVRIASELYGTHEICPIEPTERQ